MPKDFGSGYLKIGSGAADREALALILFRNGYTVSIARGRKNGKAFEYYVKYETKTPDIEEDDPYES